MNIKKVIFGAFLIFSIYVAVKICFLYIQPEPKLYETLDGKLYLESNDRILIANGIGKAFSNDIIPSVLNQACAEVGGTYYNDTCYIGKLTIIDGRGVISPGTYYKLTKEQLQKLIISCSSGNCPIGYVGAAAFIDDYIHYNVSYYKNNTKPRPVGSKVLIKIFNLSDNSIENILKTYIAKELNTSPSNIQVDIKNKLLVGKIGLENSLYEKKLAGYVMYTTEEKYNAYANHENQWVVGLFANKNREHLFLPANYRFNYTIKKDPNYKGFAKIITGCGSIENLERMFPNNCKYMGNNPDGRHPNFKIYECYINGSADWTNIWNSITDCYHRSISVPPRVFYLNYSEAKPGMLVPKNGINFKFYYPYVDCGYNQSASGTYIVHADGFNIRAILDNVTGNVVKTCISGNITVPCTELGLKTKNKKTLKLSGFNGIDFKLSLNQQIMKYNAYKIAGKIIYLIKVSYNGQEYYYRVEVYDYVDKNGKEKIAYCPNNICISNLNIYKYNDKILINIMSESNQIIYDKTISTIIGEES